MAKKGDTPLPIVTELLYANSAIGSSNAQLSYSLLTNAQRYASIVWLRRSVCPSVWGWKAVDIRGQLLSSPKNPLQVSKVNRESRSETISVGIPWCFHISRANMAIKTAAVFSFSGTKWAILVNRSRTTHNSSHSFDSGRSVMKSIAIDCQGA